jgi:hypothetical protein
MPSCEATIDYFINHTAYGVSGSAWSCSLLEHSDEIAHMASFSDIACSCNDCRNRMRNSPTRFIIEWEDDETVLNVWSEDVRRNTFPRQYGSDPIKHTFVQTKDRRTTKAARLP